MDEKELPKFDKKDIGILSILELDSRTPLSAIAKKVGLSKASVSARIKKIEDSGVINRFPIELNHKALGYPNYRLYLKFENVPEGFESKLARYLFTHGSVRWFAFTQGMWDITIRVYGKSIEQFKEFETDVMSNFGKYIKSKAFAINIDPTIHKCSYFTGNFGPYTEEISNYKGGIIPLSKLDYKILYWLYEDSRMHVSEIAKKVSASPEVVSYHIKKLQNLGIIHAFYARFNRRKLGYMETKVIFWLQYSEPKRMKDLVDYCQMLAYPSFFTQILGPWDFEIDMDAKDSVHLYKIIREIRSKFPDIIRDFTVLTKIK